MGEVVIQHGPATPDRSRRLLEARLREFHAGSPRFLFVVASRWRKQQLLGTFLKANPRTFEVPILTFQDLIGTLFREIGRGRRVASETGRRCLLEAVLEEQLRSNGENGEESPASLAEAETWVALLTGRGLTSEPLIRLHLQREDRDPEEASRWVRIFLAYRKRLEAQGWEDAAGVRLSLYEALLTGSVDFRGRFPHVREILFEGYIARTPVEKGLIRLLGDQVGKVTFSLDLNSPDEETRPFSLPVSAVRECWEGTNPKWRFHAAEAPPPVRFSRPAHREAEIRMVAREIRDLKTRRSHLRWSRVGIVCPRDESCLLLLGEVFSRLDIPWMNLHGAVVRSTNAFRVLAEYVELLCRDFRRDDLFDFLSSPWIDPDGISPDRVRLLEQLAGRGGFGGGLEVWVNSFPEWIGRELSESPEGPVSVLGERAEIFRGLIRKLQADPARTRTAGEWVSLLAGRLGPLLRPPGGHGKWGRTEGQALSRLQGSLREAALLWGDCPLSLARFRSLLHRQISRLRVFPSLDREAVVVGGARHLQECEFRHLFWLDFSEGRIPSRRRTPVSGTGSRVREELSIFHGIRCRSRETVLLSSPQHGENGPVLPSHALAYLDYREEDLTRLEPQPEPSGDTGTKENIRRGIRALSLRRSGGASAFSGVLSLPRVLDRMRRRHFSSGMDLSPVQLEEYGRCGFRYFVRTILEAEPPRPTDSDLLREQRRLIRRILSRSSQDTVAARSRGPEAERRRMAVIVREELERLKQVRPTVGGLLWEQLRTWLMDGLEDSRHPGLLSRFLEEDRGREPDSEVHSVETCLGPLSLGRIPSGDGSGERQAVPVRLAGAPDRIDRTHEGYRVVFYAAGHGNRLRRIEEGWGFRLPLSLLLVQSFLGRIAAGGYYHVSPPGHLKWRPLGRRGRKISRGDLDRLLQSYREKALLAACEIYSGRFPVTTLKPAAAGCAHCGYRGVCRREEVPAGGGPA